MSIKSASLREAFVYASSKGGVNAFAASELCASLQALGVVPTTLSDTSYLKKALTNNRATLLLPGGKTMDMGNALTSVLELARSKIGSGWNIYGSCAGGNLLCRKFTYTHRDRTLGIVDITKGCQLWNLLPIDVHTPFFEDQLYYKSDQAPGKLVPIVTETSEFICYWNAGSLFKSPPSTVITEARYDASNAAVVSGFYGEGRVIATAIHPEIDVASFLALPSSEIATHKDFMELREKKQSAADTSSARLAFLKTLYSKIEIV